MLRGFAVVLVLVHRGCDASVTDAEPALVDEEPAPEIPQVETRDEVLLAPAPEIPGARRPRRRPQASPQESLVSASPGANSSAAAPARLDAGFDRAARLHLQERNLSSGPGQKATCGADTIHEWNKGGQMRIHDLHFKPLGLVREEQQSYQVQEVKSDWAVMAGKTKGEYTFKTADGAVAMSVIEKYSFGSLNAHSCYTVSITDAAPEADPTPTGTPTQLQICKESFNDWRTLAVSSTEDRKETLFTIQQRSTKVKLPCDGATQMCQSRPVWRIWQGPKKWNNLLYYGTVKKPSESEGYSPKFKFWYRFQDFACDKDASKWVAEVSHNDGGYEVTVKQNQDSALLLLAVYGMHFVDAEPGTEEMTEEADD